MADRLKRLVNRQLSWYNTSRGSTKLFRQSVYIIRDVVLEAKTTSLARHYEKEYGAVPLPAFRSSAQRYLIADEAAKRIFFPYLTESLDTGGVPNG